MHNNLVSVLTALILFLLYQGQSGWVLGVIYLWQHRITLGNLGIPLSAYSTDLFWPGKHEFAPLMVFCWKRLSRILQFSFPHYQCFVTVFFSRLVLFCMISIMVQIEMLNAKVCLAAHLRRPLQSLRRPLQFYSSSFLRFTTASFMCSQVLLVSRALEVKVEYLFPSITGLCS